MPDRLLPLLAPLWVASWLVASILYRRRAGKPIFPRNPSHARFAERGCSGASHRNLLTRIGGAGRCLLVAVTADRLEVRPFFPFNLMFLPEIYGLEHSIPGAAIGEVEDRQGYIRRSVLISYDFPEPRRIELRVKDPDALLAALRDLRRSAAGAARRDPRTEA